MNIYIYDSFLNQKKYERLLARLEIRLTDLGLNGKISRLGLMRNIPDIVKSELKRGAKTIIAVGNNRTVNQIINAMAGSAAALGIIPIGQDNNDLAKGLGVATTDQACDILSARLLTKLDLGLANQSYFLGHASISSQDTEIDMNNNYTIETSEKGLIHVFNLANPEIKLLPLVKFKPDDGMLELVISAQSGKKFFAKQESQSIFKIQKVTINNPGAQLLLDGSAVISPPARITVVKQCLNVIIGKNKNF